MSKSQEGEPKDPGKIVGVNEEIQNLRNEADKIYNDDNIKSLFGKAEVESDRAYQEKDFSEAIDEYKRALKSAQKSFAEAIDKYKKALKLSQKNRITETERRYKEAEIDYEIGNYESALRKYKAAVSEARKGTARLHKNFNVLARYKIALCYTNLAHKVADIKNLLEEGDSAYDVGDYLISAKIYEKALEESRKENAEIKNNEEEAQNKTAEDKNNGKIESFRKKAETAYSEGNYQEALNHYATITQKSWKFDRYTLIRKKSWKWGIEPKYQEDARKFFKKKEYQRAAKKYKQALAKSLDEWSVEIQKDDEYKTALSNLPNWSNEAKSPKGQPEKTPEELERYQEIADNYTKASSELLDKWKEHFNSLALEYIGEIDASDLENTLDDYQEGIAYLESHIKFVKNGDKSKLEYFIEKFPNSRFKPYALYTTGNINRLIKEFPDFPLSNEARFLRAQQYLFEDNDFKNAYQNYKVFLDSYPEDASKVEEALYRSLYCRWQLILEDTPLEGEDLDTLLNDYSNFTSNKKDSKFLAAAYFDMGNIYLNQKKDYDEASRGFESAVTEANGNTEYSEMIPIAILGKAHSDYRQEDKFEEVIEYLKNENNKKYFQTGNRLNDYKTLFQSAKKKETLKIWNLSNEADEAFRQAEEEAKKDNSKSKAAKMYKDAATKYQKVCGEEAPDDFQEVRMLKFRARFLEGLSHFNASDFTNAATAYETAIQDFKSDIKPKDLKRCQYNLTVAYERQGDWKNARKTYEEMLGDSLKGISKDSSDYAHYQLLVAMSPKDGENVEDAYRNVIANASSEDDKNLARINLAKLYLQAEPKRYAEAYDLYSKVKNDIQAQYMAIVCYYYQIRDKKPDDVDSNVVDIFQELINTNNPSSELTLLAYSTMMQIYERFEKWSEIVKLANEVKIQFPEFFKNSDFVGENSLNEEIKNKFPKVDSQKVEELKKSLANINKLSEHAERKEKMVRTVDDYINNVLRPIAENESLPAKERAKAKLKIGHLLYKDQRYEVKDKNGELTGDAIYEYKEFEDEEFGKKFPKDYTESASDVLIAKYQIASCYYQLGKDSHQSGQDPKKPNDERMQYYKQAVAYYQQAATEAQEILSTSNLKENMQVSIHYLLGMVNYNLMDINDKRSSEEGEKIGTSLFYVDDFKNLTSLASKLRDAHDPLSQYLRGKFSTDTQQLLEEYDGSTLPSETLQMALIDELNQLLQDELLYNEQHFPRESLSEEILRLIEQNPQREALIYLKERALKGKTLGFPFSQDRILGYGEI